MNLNVTIAEALWLLPFALPICVWVAWSDMRDMRIPNVAVLALTAVFLVVGVLVLPFETYAWRWLHLVIILVAGFIITSLGMVGAGDAKFAAAMAPFVAAGDILFFLVMFAGVLIVTWILHRTAKRVPAIRRATPHWTSWEQGKLFPMGIALAAALVLYLGLGIASGQ